MDLNFYLTWFGVITLGETVRYLLVAGGMFLAFLALSRWLAPRKIQDKPLKFKDVRREIAASLVSCVVFAGVITLTIVGLYTGVLTWRSFQLSVGATILFQIAMAIGHDTYFYWTHRMMHGRRLFRTVHLTHHQSKAPTALASYAFSPIEAAVQVGFVPLWVLLVPTAPENVGFFVAHQVIHNAFGHSGYELAWPGFARGRITQWFATTTHHDLHHSEGRYNFGLWFTWWDRMMGTEHPHYRERFDANARPLFRRRGTAQAAPVAAAGSQGNA
ncbi:sterol desaturase family protein [Sphingomonas sp. BGYR3]|uniref:sterol desaturase family protein n=1 Tax=Sphingomonas sp. BGYR3 TaxID=2975483 RepID=UPI0021A7E998|nr:sterol desaturase family protein [Sphingomonas sp. BGYR3]MDG5487557.1 sterol desaturase family protein [Sphingomonas sp. BGYR3]